jgi:hypothetical protein
VGEATSFSEGARRNHGWLYVLDEDLQRIAQPCDNISPVPPELDGLLEMAIAKWAQRSYADEMLMMLTPTISARVFSMHGPGGSCTVVYLEPLVVRVRK